MNSVENSLKRFDDLMQQLLNEKERREKAEALLDEAQLKLDSLEAGYKMISEKGHDWSHLHTRVIELAERVAEEHFKVMQLQKSRSLLLGHIRILRCCLSHDQVKNSRTLHQLESKLSKEHLRNIRECDKLKSKVSSTRQRYRRRLSSTHKLLRSSHRSIHHLKNTTRKMKTLCSTLERRYQVIIFELGQEIRSIAQMLSPFHLPQLRSLQPGLSASEIGRWFAGIQQLSHQIQNYIVHNLSTHNPDFHPEFSESYISFEDIDIVKNIIDTSLIGYSSENHKTLQSQTLSENLNSKVVNLKTSSASSDLKIKISTNKKVIDEKDLPHKNIDGSCEQNFIMKDPADRSAINSFNNTSDISFDLIETSGSPFSHNMKTGSEIFKCNTHSEEHQSMSYSCNGNLTTEEDRNTQDEDHGSHLRIRLIRIMDSLKDRLVQQHLDSHARDSSL